MSLPSVSQASLNVRPIDWLGLPKRFLNPGELEVIIALIKSIEPEPRWMMEFGVNEGRTARSIIREVRTIEGYIGVDVPKTYVPSKKVQRDEVPEVPGKYVREDPLFRLILKARGTLDLKISDIPARSVCCVFIDGDHGAAAVYHDTELAQAWVRPGGLIIWHDYHELGTVDVKEVLDRFHANGMPIEHVEGTWLAYHKVN